MKALRPAERRSLVLLAELAATRRDAPAVLRAEAARWPAALRLAAGEVASAWERGERPAILEAPASAERTAEVRGEIERRATLPAFTASLGLLASCVALAVAAPPVHALLVESAPLLGGALPSPLLALLAAHARLVLAAGLVASVVLAAAPLVASRLPLAGRLRSALAVHAFAEVYAERLRSGAVPHDAAAVAARACTWRRARRRLEHCVSRLRAGEPPESAFVDPRLPLLAGLRASALAGEPEAAAGRVQEHAAHVARCSAVRLGRGAALAAHALTLAAAILLVVTILVPLATFGGTLP